MNICGIELKSNNAILSLIQTDEENINIFKY